MKSGFRQSKSLHSALSFKQNEFALKILTVAFYLVETKELRKTSTREDKNEANNNKRNSATHKVNELTKISETKDLTSRANNNRDKKSKTCCIL